MCAIAKTKEELTATDDTVTEVAETAIVLLDWMPVEPNDAVTSDEPAATPDSVRTAEPEPETFAGRQK